MIAEQNPQIKKAAVTLKALSADERIRYMYERREKARRDEESQMRWARQEGWIEGLQEGRQERIFDVARNLLGFNVPVETIIKSTGLTREDVESLRD